MDMLHAMRTFARVVECGSFAAAANALDISAAQVSRIVAELENQLQTRLLHRTTRRLRMSEAGERFLERSRQIMLLTEEAMDEARGAHLTPRGRLRLHCTHGLGLLMMPLVARYNASCPEVVMELTLSQRNPDPLAEGHDVVIAIGQGLPDSQLIAIPLGSIHSILCASPDTGLARRAQTAAGLARAHLPAHRRSAVRRGLDLRQGTGKLRHRAPGYLPHQCRRRDGQGHRAGHGGRVAAVLLGQPGHAGRAPVPLLAPYRLRQREIYAIYPSRHYLDAKVRTWIDYLKEQLPLLFAEHQRVVDEAQYWR
jgi:DNA-binding transcriptional LysR family regulator